MMEMIKKSKMRDEDYAYSIFRKSDTINKWKGKLDPEIIDKIKKDVYRSHYSFFL
jgi:hypothetical protein